MNIVIVGPGAIGILFGVMLARSGQDVCFFDHRKARIEHIKKNGVLLKSKDKSYTQKIAITDKVSDLKDVDLFIICVKSYNTKDAAEAIKPAVGEKSFVLTLQNGIGNVEVLAEILGEDKLIAGVTSQGANVIEDGKVQHAGFGETIIGKIDGTLPICLRSIREAFNKAGLKTLLSKDIRGLLWSKLIINVGVNALAAVTRLRNGDLLSAEGTRIVLRQLVSEAVKVAKRKRIKLIYDDAIEKTEAVCEATAQNICSMLQDILNSKKTEIEYINGAIVRQGQSLGIATPANAFMLHLVNSMEAHYNRTVPQKGYACK